jgi:Na+/H+ antiporter NhaD/arsenite permease-like protein
MVILSVFFIFFEKKTRRRKDTQEKKKKKKKKKKRLELVILTLYYVNVCSLSIKTTLSLQNLLCIQIMRKKSSSSSDSDFLSLSVCYRLVYFISRRRRGCGYDVSTISLFYYNIIKQT